MSYRVDGAGRMGQRDKMVIAALRSRGPSEALAKTPEWELGTRRKNFIDIIARNFLSHSNQPRFL